ncbi:hypothetical protein AGDE_15386 [Angomonas deanei]|nr:hypothetical protein AGDE_15386 [Angomonas deanei]|eukprot:EPY19173.1 hypothetical protein AGDE_15386 [Angomonas deanei]
MLLTPSIVNALLTLGGILLVSYVEYLHLHFYSLWRPIATLFLLLPVLSVVSHLPWMHHLFSKSEAWASTILGFDDNYYFSLEGEHVVVLFLVFLQTKLYNSFIYGNILQNLYFEVIERQRRFNERQLRLKKENEAALQAARDYEKVLHARIAQLREGRTSPTGASPPPSSPPTTARRKESAGDVVRVAVQECALLLASHTYEPVVLKAHVLQHSSDLSSSLRTLGFVFKKFLEHHTVTLVVLSALLNALLTGCAYELGALLYILAVPLAYNPYAPRATYQFLLLYITTGILLKTVVQLVLVEHPPSELASMILSRLLVRVSSVGEEDGGEERETKFSFGMDYITFIAVVFHQFICVSNGVYNNDDVDRQLREETEPLPPNDELEMVDNSEDDVVSVEDDESDLSVRIAAEEAKAYLHCTTRFAKSVSDYWSNLISVCGVGEEVYVWYTLLNMISIVVVVVGYGNMAGGHSVTIQENVENNLLPAKMVLMVTVAVALLVVERALYVRRLQSAKVILNIVVYVAYCTVYWVWRYGAPSSLVFGNILFLVKVAEVYFSVLQVRKGFPLHRRPDPFSTRPQVQFLTWCYSLFRAIPFLWECRTLLDWSLEHTSLELNEYLKVEDVYDHVYRRRVDVCAGASRQPPRTLGSPVQPSSKWSAGVTRAGLILLALLAPLWYYSSLNPSVSSNEVRQAKFSLSFDGFSPFFTASLDHTMPLPESWPTWIVRTRPSLTSYGIEQKEKKVQLAQFSTCGSDVWRISPDLFNEMQRKLELVVNESATVSIVQEIEVVRTASAASSSLTQLTSTQWPVTASTAADLLNLLVNHTFHRPVELLWFYTPFVLNRPSSVGFYPRSSDPLNYVNCSLQLRQARDPLLGQRVLYWCSTCDPLFTRGNIPREKDNYAEWSCLTSGIGCKAFNYDESAPVYNTTDATPMYLVFLSDNVVVGLSFLNKFGLVALYTTFVLAFGRLLRSMMTGKAQQVVLSDMTDPIPLLQVIQCIQTAREAGELVVEHRVYLDLIDLLRSPERLLTVTGLKSNSYGETTEVAVEATAERPQTDQANRE